MKHTILTVLISIAFVSSNLQAQSVDEEIRAMRAEIQRLREEVAALRQEVHPDAQQLSPAEAVPILQAQVQEQAQTKIETSTKFPMKVFGKIVSNTFWNSGEANWLDLPNLALPN